MARYGTFKYGTGIKYGTSPTTTDLLWTFMVKWDGEYYSGENEATRMTGLTIERGRDYLVQQGAGGLEHYQPGRAVAILDNDDGRYDPFNTSSPLYPNVEPGKFCRFLVKNGNTGTNYDLMRGIIADIRPYTQGNRKLVAITVLDGIQYLYERTVKVRRSSLGFQEKTYAAGVRVLRAADWPEDEWPIPVADAVGESGIVHNDFEAMGTGGPAYAAWNKNALSEMEQLSDFEGGVFFHARDGDVWIVPGGFDRASTVAIDGSQLLKDIYIPMPWDVIRNFVEVAVYNVVYDNTPGTEFWKMDAGSSGEAAIAIANGGEVILEAQFRGGGDEAYGIDGVLTHEVNTSRTGGGSDLTTNCPASFEGDHVSPGGWPTTTMAEGTTITITNNSGSNGFIIDLNLTGTVGYIRQLSSVNSRDATSIAKYGTKAIRIDSRWMRNASYAQTLADWWKDYFASAKLYPTIKIEQRPTLQYPLDLYIDVISLTVSSLGIADMEFRIGKIEHRWKNENGQAVETTLKLEPWVTPFS